jgi:hypothetical protein
LKAKFGFSFEKTKSNVWKEMLGKIANF